MTGIHTFQDRSQFLDALKSIEWTSPCAKASYIDYLSAFENRRYSQYNHDYLFRKGKLRIRHQFISLKNTMSSLSSRRLSSQERS